MRFVKPALKILMLAWAYIWVLYFAVGILITLAWETGFWIAASGLLSAEVIFIVHVIRNKRIRKDDKYSLIPAFLVFGIFLCASYWLKYVWRAPAMPSKRPAESNGPVYE